MSGEGCVGIYIHVPFCAGKCPYCDFYSVNCSRRSVEAYVSETVRRIGELEKYCVSADTVYLGGGTPSLLTGGDISRIMAALRQSVRLDDNAEITVEANPSSDLREFLRMAADAGVNRLSLGMQSAVPAELKAIGRRHSPSDVLAAMDAARSVGVDNISLDLMLGIPHQTRQSLGASLEFVERASPSHISAYMLKIEEGTPFYSMKGSLPLPDDDETAELYELAFDRLESMGYSQYEISNASRSGMESRHNLRYWDCREYIGLGPSAHGFFRGKRYFFNRSLEDYLKGCAPEFDCDGGAVEEYVMLRLRLSEGLVERDMMRRFGSGIPAPIKRRAEELACLKLCVCDSSHISLTRKGMLVSNAVIAELLARLD